jgi:bla regulator protein BlaR1
MIPKYLYAMWPGIASAMGNHLWQSTLVAVAAGLLTLLLRKNQARVRYRLWLAASVKFIVPFSLLTAVGNHLASSRGSVVTRTGLYLAVEQVSRPLTPATMATISRGTSSTAFPSLIHLLPVLLVAAWFSGFLAVLVVWYRSWRRISAAKREAVPLLEGREVEALRRLERLGGMRERIEILVSPASLEPGIFGIARPVLIWPAGISGRLEDAHLEAVLAHELWHVRRRDNLAAALHMVVEAIFWFHPIVWWLGTRLVEERELACDEQVLEFGGERQVYAESILKVCEFCLRSPLTCVSGVTGADLKKRIVHIMSEHLACKLDFSRKLLLSTAGLVAVALPIAFGLINATPSRALSRAENTVPAIPVYSVTSIKANKSIGTALRSSVLFSADGLAIANMKLQSLLQIAYNVEGSQISGGPGWLDSARYDIAATVNKSAADALGKLGPDQRKLANQRILQALLADQFKLTVHVEAKELPQYVLTVAENGPKLHKATPGDTYPNGIKGPDGHSAAGLHLISGGSGQLVGQGLSMDDLVRQLSVQLSQTVLDKTGLTDNYDFTLHWTPDDNRGATASGQQGDDTTPPAKSSEPSISIFTALQEQLGLKLESQTAPVEILVIDHVEAPAEN